jgi:hypothetical protein
MIGDIPCDASASNKLNRIAKRILGIEPSATVSHSAQRNCCYQIQALRNLSPKVQKNSMGMLLHHQPWRRCKNARKIEGNALRNSIRV